MMPVRGMLLSRGAVYRNPFTDYNRALKRYPLTTKCLTCALGMSIGDLIAQVMAKRAKSKRFRQDLLVVGMFDERCVVELIWQDLAEQPCSGEW